VVFGLGVALFPSPLRCLFRAPRPCWRSTDAEELASPAAVSHSRQACLARVAPPAVIRARSRRAVLCPGPRRGQAEHGRVRAPHRAARRRVVRRRRAFLGPVTPFPPPADAPRLPSIF